MSIKETRQLGIEFERRLHTMIPATELSEKLDTDTIYAYLNQYQDKYVHEIYRSLDSIPSGTKIQARFDKILQPLLASIDITKDADQDKTDNIVGTLADTSRSLTFKLPNDFQMYIRSVTSVSKSFQLGGKSEGSGILSNISISQNDLWKVLETPNNSLRILRNPLVVINQLKDQTPTITLIHDQYTDPQAIRVIYYKQPKPFSILTNTPCELPVDVFDDLVSGAVDLYVNYAAGAEAKKRQQMEQAQKRAREDQRDSRRSGGNQDEQS